MKKIIYISNSRIPTEMAHGIQIMNTCKSLAGAGNNVELIVPTRRNRSSFKNTDPFLFYGAEKNFKLKKIWSFDPTLIARLPNGFYIKFQAFFFIISLFFYLLFLKNKKENIFYARDEYLLPIILKFSKNVFWEAHTLPKNSKHYLKFWEKCAGIVAITQGLKDDLIKLGVEENKIIVAPDGVDLKNYELRIMNYPPERPPTQQDYSRTKSFSRVGELREKYSLPIDKKIVMYTGHLYDWKGAQTLAESAEFLDNDTVIVFVGGTDFDLNNFRNKNKELIENNKILMLGQKSPKEIPEFLSIADCLILPNSAKESKSEKWTSPLKMFEYMASGKPIVASDLSSIREVLNENNAILVEPDNPEKLTQGIKRILSDKILSEKLSTQAKEDVKNYTWQKRAEKIIEFIKL
jgi:glycosyltransferase involved in cell wall biosynthesis